MSCIFFWIKTCIFMSVQTCSCCKLMHVFMHFTPILPQSVLIKGKLPSHMRKSKFNLYAFLHGDFLWP